MKAQLPLMMRDADRASIVASRLRKTLRVVAEELGLKVLGDDWRNRDGKPVGHATVSNKIDGRERNDLHLDEFIDLLLRDRVGLRILTELAEASGCIVPEHKPAPDPQRDLAKLDSALEETLGAEVAELVRRKAGLL